MNYGSIVNEMSKIGKQRPKTSSSCIAITRNASKSKMHDVGTKFVLERPASAKEQFEFCNHKRNEEAWKQEDLVAAVNLFKKREWQTKYYNELSGPKYMEDKLHEAKERAAKEKFLNERKEKLIQLLKNDEIQYEIERGKKSEEGQKLSKFASCSTFYPEVEILKTRLQELKLKNDEEYKKVSEKLSYEAWRKNTPEVRQVESDRLNKFIKEAWVDQKKWQEDEKQKHTEEIRKMELEAMKEAREQEERERQEEAEKDKKLIEWRRDLDQQNLMLQNKEKEEIALAVQENELEKERRSLEEIIRKRDRLKELRKRKEIELFWAAQFRLKLKKKASHIQSELTEDENIIEDLLRKPLEIPTDKENQRIEEAKWMKHVLEEQKKLEIIREKEYDLLFTEDAEKMWHQRQADWQREQNARDKLMQEVMLGLQKQIDEKLSSTQNYLTETKNEKSALIASIQDKQNLVEKSFLKTIAHSPYPSHHRKLKVISPTNEKDLRIDQQQRKREIEENRKEVARLEEEMKKLWEDSYLPPRFGRKKVNW